MTLRILLLGAALLLLAACGHSPPTQFLTLDPAPAVSSGAIAYRGPSIRVPAVRIPPALDRDEFVQRSAPGEMKVDDLVRWSAPVGLLSRNTLIIDLASRLPPGAVAPPDAPAQSAGLRVDVSILSLETTDSEASMQAAYQFTPDDGQASAIYRQWATLRLPIAARTPPETARAFSTLLGQLADRIAGDLASGTRTR
jgi:uncharacterized lipoprotein YmbA